MAAFLERDLATIALCWRLERRDGVTLGFTTHDRDLEIGGLTYRAAPGMLPSAISVSDGFDADSVDIKGALTSDAISGADLAAGRWDGASVRILGHRLRLLAALAGQRMERRRIACRGDPDRRPATRQSAPPGCAKSFRWNDN